ncbi:MAG: putative DNA binding domain-containing protein [Deltaproteobacteria bacterium]|nr:putative DNA binding domain-containing protein [Deltaproteobacteria bacterium]
MDDSELELLLADLESDRSERTTSTTDTDKFGEAMCAFANDLPNHRRPGYLFVGAKPDGAPSGASITDQLLQNLALIRAQGNLLPQPTINVEKRWLRGGPMAVIEVLPSDLAPIRYKGRVWVRVGPARALASEADERVLAERRATHARTWDARPCAGAEISDLTLALFEAYKLDAIARDVLDENHRSMEDQLASLRLLDRRTGTPTHAAILLFGKDVLQFLPGAYVQYVRYGGPDAAADVERERQFSGDLLSVLREISAVAEELANGRPMEVGPLQETTVFDYPPAALREIFVNAVIHRDYESNTPVMLSQFSDRLEILNPGGLYGDIRVEDFPGATAYRNPVLAEAAKTLGFVNRFGRGVPRTQEAMDKNGSPPPEFNPKPRHFLVLLRKRP